MTTRLRILGIIFVSVFGNTVISGTGETLVVMDFANENVSAGDARTVTERIRTALVDYNLFEVVEREKFKEIIAEQGQQLSGCFDDECVVKMGRMVGARYMVAGRVNRSTSGFYLSARIIDVESTKMLAKKDLILRSDDIFEILELAPNLVYDLMQQFIVKRGLALGSEAVTLGMTRLGKVKLKLLETNVHLIIDSESRGYIPSNVIPIQLSGGIHQISIDKEGFEPWSESINVLPDSTTVRTVKLEKSGDTVQTVLDWSFLTIATEPENAAVIIDGVEYGQTYFNGKVSSGKHTLLLSKPLYYDLIKEIELERGEMLNLKETLKPNFGRVTINTNPPVATIMIDGKIETRKTPCTIKRLQSGQHDIRLSYPEYRAYESVLLVDDGKETTLDVDLKPAFGFLHLTSTPVKAEVKIGEAVIGQTPIENYKLMSGEHLLNVKADFYKEVQEIITIEDGKKLQKNVSLPPNFGKLSVQAVPAGAKIFIDAHFRGESPALIEPVLVGSHDIRIEAGEHYRAERRKVFIGLGQVEVIQTALKEKIGELMISSNPPGAKILVDGEYYKLDNGNIATTPIKLSRVWAGKRMVSFDLPGYMDGKTEVDVIEDQTKVVRAALDKIVFIKPRKEALWRSAVLPGFGQFYEERYTASLGYFSSEILMGFVLFNLRDSHSNLEADYRSLRHDYENLNGTTEEIQAAWNDVQDAFNEMDNNYTLQQVVAGTMIGVYLWNIVDSWVFMPKIAERNIQASLYNTGNGIGILLGVNLP